ncbi:glutamate racemase [Clostridium sp. MT-14]|jgi:glutamate racemase|uniref:Glutamate racemase n=1 Tax=Clostridium aromativorans TaxID=2836848 RepID=A0ABS8N6Z7_9CLOT|nr:MULTISPECIES: glutamate racemase [Clostridium]KAA8672948.1 glutamate racemase [Clostridium sp. HV4-5-A1G]MCC9294513.1 glutamate racemase [Clostridium aromativorans]CAB1254840.1 Glutamate racemase [Clostridiaceae bacterium BL-3]
MESENRPIGFFDSGIGGISVLKEAVKILPNENYVYFGDSKMAPYGIRTVENVKELTLNAVKFLLKKDIKALVIACNTATSAAIIDLRKEYSKYMPVIGIEPALKPAMEINRIGKVVIMATTMTLSEKKFNNLMKKYDKNSMIEPLPCPGLVELIEQGIIKGKVIEDYLNPKLLPLKKQGIAAVVLGCTHYPFIKESISKILGNDIPIIDGSKGTVQQLKRQLIKYNIINKNIDKLGSIKIFNSMNSQDIIKLSYELLKR